MGDYEQGLKQSREIIGELLPVLKNKRGIIIDGRHRKAVNRNWKEEKVDLDELQTFVARLVINTQRRIADEADYREIAEHLIKKEPGKDRYHVASGKTVADRISELTGIHERVVRYNLPDKFKGPQKAESHSASLGPGERVHVPKSLARDIEGVVEEAKRFAEKNPHMQHQIVQDLRSHLQETRETLRQKTKQEALIRKFANSVEEKGIQSIDAIQSSLSSDERQMLTTVLSQGTPQALQHLTEREDGTVTEFFGLQPVDVTPLLKPLFKHASSIGYTCSMCGKEQSIRPEKLRFIVEKTDFPKFKIELEEALVGTQKRLTDFSPSD